MNTYVEGPSGVTFKPSTLVELLRWRALQQPDRLAYTFLVDGEAEEVRFTYAELDARARAIATRLQSRGAGGKRALLLYPPGLDYIAAFFGCLYAGAVAVPAYPPDPARLHRTLPRLQAIIADAQATFALTTEAILSLAPLVFDAAPDLKSLAWLATDTVNNEPMDNWQASAASGATLAFLQYTSGSTGTPRGVMLTHDHLLYNLALIRHCFGQTVESLAVIWLPPYHDMGLIGGILQPLFTGFPAILMAPMAFLRRPFRWLQAISRSRATTSGGPNFAYDLCLRKINAEERATLDLSTWTVAFNGAEPIRPETMDRFAAAFAPCGFRREAFYPCYGLAEATLVVSGGSPSALPVIRSFRTEALETNRVVAARGGSETRQLLVGCGRSLPGQSMLVVDPQSLTACRPDQIGEIWLSGPSVAQGYWNRPDETTATFRARLADTGDGPFLRTGDLGFLHKGELFIAGRLKDLVIIRGLNYYPQDIERVVEESHASLRSGCNAAFSVAVAGEERLVIVQEAGDRGPADPKEVIEAIRQAVADAFQIQAYAVLLIRRGTIPKTSSGKIQRHACRMGYLNQTLDVESGSVLDDIETATEAVTLSTEQLIVANPDERRALVMSYLLFLSARILGVDPARVRQAQSLAHLGFDSLMATELSTCVMDDLGVAVSPVDVLRGPSLSEFVDQILSRWTIALAIDRNGVSNRAEPLCPDPIMPLPTRLEPGTDRPLSFAQQRLWFLDQLVPGNPFYNIPVALHLAGPLKVSVLEQAFNEIIQRHQALRVVFSSVEGQPIHRLVANPALSIPVMDLSAFPEPERSARLRQRAREEVQGAFDLSQGPLMRVVLIRLDRWEHILLVTVHHIIADGWSIRVLLQELTLLYESLAMETPTRLAELPIQYTDFVRWQREWLRGEVLETQLSYWKQKLNGSLPLLPLPADHPRPAVQAFHGARQAVALPKDLSVLLKALSRQEGVTLFMTLLAAFQTLLHRYTGQTDISVGTAIHNRNRREVQSLIGLFANTLVLRTDLSGNPTFRELLRRVRQTALEAYAHQDVPFEKVVEAAQPERHLSYTPLFQVMFILQDELNAAIDARRLPDLTLTRRPELEETFTSKRDLALHLMDEPAGLTGFLEYDTDLFEAETITRLLGHFQTVLESVVSDLDRRLSDVSILTSAERRQLLVEWMGQPMDPPPSRTLPRSFEAQVERAPLAIAVTCGEEQLTYRELNGRANQVARCLQRLGVGPETRVGLCLERSLDAVIGLWGILKAGGAYVPLDPSYPKDRLAFILKDAGIAILLTQSSLAPSLPPSGASVLCLDRETSSIDRQRTENLDVPISSANLAYVIYTSGSTGVPKGVMITHGNLSYYVPSMAAALGVTPDDRYLHTASFAFSSSVRQLMTPLLQGATVVLATSDQIRDPLALSAEIKARAVSIIDVVPSYWRTLTLALSQLESAKRAALLPPKLRLILSASEPLPSEVPRHWTFEFMHAAELINMFGQTETSGIVSVYPIPPVPDERAPWVPLGRPIANTQIYLLDERGAPVPIGVPGEICVGSPSLGRGWLNHPDLTAAKFIPNPFSQEPGARLYKTSDLGRYRPDGTLQFLGRMDHQVKIRGVRIELGEIEAALAQHPAVLYAVATARQNATEIEGLIGYVVLKRDATPSTLELQRFLREKLPEYMIPSAFVILDTLPMTPNGKVDRRVLPAPESARPALESEFVAPQNPVEATLASIWAEVLGIERIGIHDNFFALGGHSLAATQVIARVRRAFQVELPLRKLFEQPTIAGLASVLETPDGRVPTMDASDIRPLPRGDKSIELLLTELDPLSAEEVLTLLGAASQPQGLE